MTGDFQVVIDPTGKFTTIMFFGEGPLPEWARALADGERVEILDLGQYENALGFNAEKLDEEETASG